MSRAQDRNSMVAVLGSFGWPILFGLAGCSVFYALIFKGPLATGSMQRYFATHPVAYVATAMFFIGMAALIVKLVDVVGQFRAQGAVHLDAPPDDGQTVEECGDMLDWLAELPDRARESYFGTRIRNALETVERKGTADGLDEELKYLSDLDAERQQSSYSLVRIIIWATPMLGFLGTVVGITQALGNLDPVELASSIQTGMQKLLDGLYVAFDTTALALSLSIVLMFVQFLVERIETQLLAQVDERANEELVGRFQQVGAAGDPHVASVEKMCRTVAQSNEDLLQRQTELWQKTIDAAHGQWSSLVSTSVEHTQQALSAALKESLEHHAKTLTAAEQAAAELSASRWDEKHTALAERVRVMHDQQREMHEQQSELSQLWQTALMDTAEKLHDQQGELRKQSELLGRAVDATADVIKLEQALNNNLQSLAGSQNFSDTVMSLSAAIHLLNARLGQSPQSSLPRIDLNQTDAQGRAA